MKYLVLVQNITQKNVHTWRRRSIVISVLWRSSVESWIQVLN